MGSDVLIVGGGPAGLYASLLLARQGYKVTVLEEHTTVGSPVHCTGILAAEAFERYNLPRNAILNALRQVRFYSPQSESFQYSTDHLEAVVIDRQIFDDDLAALASRAGASLLRGQKVTDVEIGDSEATVQTVGGKWRGKAVVLACGGNYVLQRRLGLGVPSAHLQTCQIETPANRTGDVELYFGRRVAPRGFAWVVPFQRQDCPHVRIGLVCDRDAHGHFQSFLKGIASKWGVRTIDIQPRRKILPLSPIPKTFANRLLVIGDAAGIVKPTTGGGIHYSIATAELAVRVLSNALQNNALDETSLSGYETLWREHFGQEVETQLRFRLLAEKLEDTDIDDLFHLARTDGVVPLVRRTIQFNYHREFIVELLKHPQARGILLRRVLIG
jgi:geranylgeranyl reductase family protein